MDIVRRLQIAALDLSLSVEEARTLLGEAVDKIERLQRLTVEVKDANTIISLKYFVARMKDGIADYASGDIGLTDLINIGDDVPHPYREEK